MRLEDYDDTEPEYEYDTWYQLWDDLVNGYYFFTDIKGKKFRRDVPTIWQLQYEQLFNLPSHYGILVKGADTFQLKYIRVLACKYNADVKITYDGIEISLPDDDIV